jgi:hypothetical protein
MISSLKQETASLKKELDGHRKLGNATGHAQMVNDFNALRYKYMQALDEIAELRQARSAPHNGQYMNISPQESSQAPSNVISHSSMNAGILRQVRLMIPLAISTNLHTQHLYGPPSSMHTCHQDPSSLCTTSHYPLKLCAQMPPVHPRTVPLQLWSHLEHLVHKYHIKGMVKRRMLCPVGVAQAGTRFVQLHARLRLHHQIGTRILQSDTLLNS